MTQTQIHLIKNEKKKKKNKIKVKKKTSVNMKKPQQWKMEIMMKIPEGVAPTFFMFQR